MSSVKVTITINPEVIENIDKVRGLIPRSTYIANELSKLNSKRSES